MNDKAAILAIDDTSESLILLVRVLTNAGYEVRPADSGELALASVTANPPDLILLDVRMKGMDGLEVCRRLKANEQTRHIPIILVSAFAEVREWVEGLQMGASDCITKPFQPEELLTRVKTHLSLTHANISLEQQSAVLRQVNEQLQSEITQRQHMEDELRQNLDRAERSRQAMLSALEDQKQAEDALRESEAYLRTILDATPFPIALVDAEDNNIGFWSQSALTLFGHTAPTTAEWYQMAYPDPDYRREVIERWKPFLERARQTAQAVNSGEYRVTCRDGSVRICELYAAFLAGKLIVTFNDITERKQAETELRQSEERFRRAVLSAPFPIMIHAEDGEVVTINAPWTELTGYEHSDIPTIADWTQKAYGARMEQVQADIDILYAMDGPKAEGEYTIMTRSGQALTWDFSSSPIGQLPDGRRLVISMAMDITERKQAENTLRETNEYLDSLFNYANAPIIVWDPQFKITRFNHAFETMTGRSAAEVLGQALEILFPPALIPASMSLIQKTISGERWEVVEISIQHVDGSIRTVLWNSATLFSADGTIPIATIAQGQDITERKQAEEALRESEEKYRNLFANAQVGMYRSKLDGSAILDVNQKLADIFGCSIQEMLVNPAMIRWADSAARNQMVAELRRTGSLHDYEMNILTKNGEVRTLLISSSLNSELGYLEGSGMDITERKQAEEKIRNLNAELEQRVTERTAQLLTANTQLESELAERKRVQDALLESEERSRRLSEAAFEAIIIHDGGILLNANNQYAVMFGYELEELMGQQVMPLTIAPDSIETVKREIAAGSMGPYEATGQKKDGTRFPMEIRVRMMEYKGRKARVAAIMDITERKQTMEVLLQRTAQLEATQEQLVRQERLATLGQLAGSVGHELRNPLGVISNAVYFLKLIQPNASEKVKDYLDIIEKEMHTSDKIVTDLLDFTRIKSMDLQPASVSELVRETLDRYPVPPSVEVALEIPADLPQIYADPQHILQIFGNLISNACQAMAANLPNGRKLKVSAAAQGAMIKIDVQDVGVGIPPENMKKLFEPLFTTKIKGIGLGLAVSRKLVEANGGRIEVESEVGKGSTFTVYLPVYKER